MSATDFMDEVENKERVLNETFAVQSSHCDNCSQGCREKVTLTNEDVNYILAGGLILVTINGTEYCLAITHEEGLPANMDAFVRRWYGMSGIRTPHQPGWNSGVPISPPDNLQSWQVYETWFRCPHCNARQRYQDSADAGKICIYCGETLED